MFINVNVYTWQKNLIHVLEKCNAVDAEVMSAGPQWRIFGEDWDKALGIWEERKHEIRKGGS